MNTELVDYIKTLSKKEFFLVSLIDMVLSIIVIVCGIISMRTGANTLLYTIMFACATVLLGLNAYKCFKRGSKNGIVFAIMTVLFATITGICVYALIGGI